MVNHDRHGHKKTMRAVMWEGKPFNVAVRDIPKAKLQEPEDVVVRVTTAAICGSDLHIYHGILGSDEVPFPVGHEAVGIIVEAGSAVEHFKVGDRVVIPGIPDQDTLPVEPKLLPTDLALYGSGKLFGDLGGCQAEYVRVPHADKSLVNIEKPELKDEEYLFLSDIFPTAWDGLNMANFQPGDTVAVFGAGPVGLLVAYSAMIRGAARVYSVDHVQARLDKAKSIGAIPINFTKGEPSAQILAREPNGVQRVVDACGEECLNEHLKLQQNYIITQAIKVASVGGGIGVPGVYFAQPSSEGVPRGNTISPEITFPMTLFWEKSLTMRGGVAQLLELQEPLFQLIKQGRARPGFIVSKSFSIEEAQKAYERFDKKLETKVLFKFPWREDEDEDEDEGSLHHEPEHHGHGHGHEHNGAAYEKGEATDLHAGQSGLKRNGSTRRGAAFKRLRHSHH